MKTVMISYSRDNYGFVEKLDHVLISRQIDTWIDRKDIKSPMPWRESIYQAVINAEFVILCLSAAYVKSEICRMETYLARSYRKNILPIMVDDCWVAMNDYNEFKGMNNYFVLDMYGFNSFGLIVNEAIQLNNLISVLTKTTTDNWKSFDAYISYKSSTAAYATRMANDLIAGGLKTWIATTSYDVGQNCLEWQWDALAKTSFLIVVLNEETADSFYIQNELLIAYTRKIPVLPVLADSPDLNDETTRSISRSLANNYEMRNLGEIGWFYPNRPDYDTMIKDILRYTKQQQK